MLGYLPQEFGLYPTLTAEQTLHYFAKLKGVWNGKERAALVGALLERVNLSSRSQAASWWILGRDAPATGNRSSFDR